MFKKLSQYFVVGALIIAIDSITKLVAQIYVQIPHVINRFLTFELTFNRGISWGIFHDASDKMMIIVSVIIALITAVLCWSAYHSYQRGKLILGHICIIAGSVSNLIDRALYGGVIDFILLSYKNYSWPVFNIADVAIVCGVFILIFVDEQSV